jgi:hypothetical protein
VVKNNAYNNPACPFTQWLIGRATYSFVPFENQIICGERHRPQNENS